MIHAYCSICQESFTNKSEISAFQCGHIFHFCCLNQWLKAHSTCPNCRCLGANNIIRKIYFDQVSEINNSFDNGDKKKEENSEILSELRFEIKYLKLELNERNEENKGILEKNEALENNLKEIKFSQQISEINFNNVIEEKNEEINILKKKLHSLRFVNDCINKSRDKIDNKLNTIITAGNINEEMENMCSSIVILKTDLDFYKDKSETLSKQLCRSDIKFNILNTKLESLKESSFTQQEKEQNNFSTPNKTNNPSIPISIVNTPQLLSMLSSSSPKTPASSQKKRLHQQTVSSNPFSKSSQMKKSRCDLSSLTIMSKKPELWRKNTL